MQHAGGWADTILRECGQMPSARRRLVAANQVIYLGVPRGKCFVVRSGYVTLFDLGNQGDRCIRLIPGRGGLVGDRPFTTAAFAESTTPLSEHAVSNGPAELLEVDRADLEASARSRPEFAVMLLESATGLAQFLQRRLGWQFASPVRVRLAMALRDLLSSEGQRCRHGHSVDVRLTHQDLAELVVAARPVVSAELSRLRNEGVIAYTRSYFCIDDLAGLNRIAGG